MRRSGAEHPGLLVAERRIQDLSDHAAKSGLPVPDELVIVIKAPSAVSGPNDPVVIPRGSEKTERAVELGVVIGRRAKDVTKAEALGHVAGYCVCHDGAERAFEIERSGPWTKGKSCERPSHTGRRWC